MNIAKLAFLLVILVTSAHAQEEFDEEQIALTGYVDNSGKLLLVGFSTTDSHYYMPFLETAQYIYDNKTNQIYAITDMLTSKIADSWSLNLSLEGYYSDYSVAFYFPPGSEVRGFEVSPGLNYQLQVRNDSIFISTQGYRISSPYIKIDYRQTIGVQAQPESTSGLWEYVPYFVIIILISAIMFSFIRKTKLGVSSDIKVQESPIERKEIIVTPGMQKVIETLSDNEKAIINLMLKNGGKATQADIRYEIAIPKSSLSGIINVLKRKNLIKKREYGRTNLLELSEWFLSEKEV